MPITRRLLILAFVPLLAFLVACGGDDDDGGSSSSGDNQPSASDSGGSSNDNDGDDGGNDSDGGDSDSSDNADDSSDIDAEDVIANCPEFAGFASSMAAAFAGAGTGAAEDLEDTVQYFQALADEAPPEIRADMQLLATAFASFFAVLEEYDIDFSNPATFATLDAETQVELQAALEELSGPELETASDNITAWFEENCSS